MTAIDTSLGLDIASRIAARLFSQATPLAASFSATLAAQIQESDAQAATSDPQATTDPNPQPPPSPPPQVTVSPFVPPEPATPQQAPTRASTSQQASTSSEDGTNATSDQPPAPPSGPPAPTAPAQAQANGSTGTSGNATSSTTGKPSTSDKDDQKPDASAGATPDPSAVTPAAVPVVQVPVPVKPQGGGDTATSGTTSDQAGSDTVAAIGATGASAIGTATTGQAGTASVALAVAAKLTSGQPAKAASTAPAPSAVAPASTAQAASAPTASQIGGLAAGIDVIIGKPAATAPVAGSDASSADLAKLGLASSASAATTPAAPTEAVAPTPAVALPPVQASAKPVSVNADAIVGATAGGAASADPTGKLLDTGNAAKGAPPAGTSFTVATTLDLSRAGPATTVSTLAQPVLRQGVPIDRVAFEVVSQAKSGVREVEIKLDPPELGSISVKMDMDDSGRVSAHLVVEKSSTLDQLRSDAPRLERMLSDAGLKTDSGSLQFSLRDQQSQSRQGSDTRRTRRGSVEVDPVDLNAWRGSATTTNLAAQRGGIDVRL